MRESSNWQKEQIKKRSEAYNNDIWSAQDFNEEIKDIEQMLDLLADEPTENYISAEESIERLKRKYC